jgi:hypothetical protein
MIILFLCKVDGFWFILCQQETLIQFIANTSETFNKQGRMRLAKIHELINSVLQSDRELLALRECKWPLQKNNTRESRIL